MGTQDHVVVDTQHLAGALRQEQRHPEVARIGLGKKRSLLPRGRRGASLTITKNGCAVFEHDVVSSVVHSLFPGSKCAASATALALFVLSLLVSCL